MARRFLFISPVLLLLVLAAFACESGTSGNEESGDAPVLISAIPDTASPGDTVILEGKGFSYIAPENVILMGETSTTATSYAVLNQGPPSVSFEVPEGIPAGKTFLVVVVDGHPSNRLDFTISP